MDHLLVPFFRQYLQQILPSNIRYPSPKLLVVSYTQDQLHRYCFADDTNQYLPPPVYRRAVLKRLINAIEKELVNGDYSDDEYGLSDELMADMGALSAIPQPSELVTAQEIRTLSYFLPDTSSTADPQRTSRQPILIREAPNLLAAGSNVGLRTWEACLHLASYLCTATDLEVRHPAGKPIKDANIVELGAGTALLSLVCALSLGAQHVVATDGLPHVVEGIDANIALNRAQHPDEGAVLPTSAVLDWTDPSNLEYVLRHEGVVPQYDYVLGADITYHPELFGPLASVLKRLKIMSPSARILISATVRNEVSLNQFRQVCTRDYGLSIVDIPSTDWKPPTFKDQTGLFHEQAFPLTIMDIGLISE